MFAVIGLIIGLIIVGFVAVSLFDFLDSRAKITDSSIPVEAIKISISQDGPYRIKMKDLQQLGFPAENIDTSTTNLTLNGKQVPYQLNGDFISFYGQAPNSRYTKYNTYIIHFGEPGQNMDSQSFSGADNKPIRHIIQHRRLEKNLLYDGRSAANFDGDLSSLDPWYWLTIQAQQSESIDLEIDEIAEGPATLRLRMLGVTQNPDIEDDHDLDIYVNEHLVGTITWDGEKHFDDEIALNEGVLKKGKNTIRFDNSQTGATPIDVMRLDWLELEFLRPSQADEESLYFQGFEGQLNIFGYDEKPAIFEISDPAEPSLITGWQFEDGTVTLGVTPDVHGLIVGAPQYLEPDNIEALDDSALLDADNQADMLIITTEELAPALEPLLVAREAQGITAKVVPVEDIYDEFGFGQAGPEYINQFVAYTHEQWQEPAPSYLFLVGDATYDFRDYMGEAPQNGVPSPMVRVSYSGETVSDARLADIDDDGKPDLAVGRWPVDNYQDVEDLVARTLAYEQAAQASKQAIFAADSSSNEFSYLVEELLADSQMDSDNVQRLIGAEAEEFAQAWHEGAWLVTYTGHGSLDRWGKDNLLDGQSALALKTSGPPPIVVQLTCLTGFFAHPTQTSLSETMLIEAGGPVLIVAATSLTLSTSQQPFATALLRNLQDPAVIRMGDAVLEAKLQLAIDTDSDLQEISDTFGLLGDPSALILRPARSGS